MQAVAAAAANSAVMMMLLVEAIPRVGSGSRLWLNASLLDYDLPGYFVGGGPYPRRQDLRDEHQ